METLGDTRRCSLGSTRGKRGLAMPSEADVPLGPHRQLIAALHRAYASAGRPGLRQIATGLKHDDSIPGTVNYQAIGKILNGKQLPTPRQLVSLTSWLIKESEIRSEETQDPKDYVRTLLQLRDAAHDEALGISTGSKENEKDTRRRSWGPPATAVVTAWPRSIEGTAA